MSAGEDVATHISTELASLRLGVNCFFGPVRPVDDVIPDRCVFCLESGGRAVFPYCGENRKGERHSRVSIIVRENKEEFSNGETLAIDVSDAIDMNPPTGYVEARTINTSPIYVRKTDLGNHLWSINVDLMKVGSPV